MASQLCKLNLCVLGDGGYGEHDIVEQAEHYLQASHQHPVNYKPPTVHVVFYGGVTKAIVGQSVWEHNLEFLFEKKNKIKNIKFSAYFIVL